MPSKHDTDKKKLLARRTFAAKSLAAQTGWLEMPLCEMDGRIGFEQDGEFVAIDSELLARTQRLLYKVRQDCEAAEKAVGGDVGDWLDARLQLLEHAKILSALKFGAPQSKNLTDLLNRMVFSAVAMKADFSAAARIVEFGQQACPALVALINDTSLPLPSRCLSAMVLGAIQRGMRSDKDYAAAYRWGAAHGVDARAVLYNRLLAGKSGADLAARARAACNAVRLNDRFLALAVQWIVSSASPVKLVELLENIAKTQAVKTRIQSVHPNFSRWPKSAGGVQQNAAIEEVQAMLLKDFNDTIEWAFAGRDAELPHVAGAMMTRVVDCIEALRVAQQNFPPCVAEFCGPIETCETVRIELRADCLRLVEYASRNHWDVKKLPKSNDKALVNDLRRNFLHEIHPIAAMLNLSQDAALVRRAIDNDLVAAIGHHIYDMDADVLSTTISILCGLKRGHSCRNVGYIIDAVRSTRMNARALNDLKQIASCLREEAHGSDHLGGIMQTINDWPGLGMRVGISFMAKMMPALRVFTAREEQASFWPAVYGCLALRMWGDDTAIALAPVLVAECEKNKTRMCASWTVGTSAALCSVYLCGGNPDQMRRIFEASLSKNFYFEELEKWGCFDQLRNSPRAIAKISSAFQHHPGDSRRFFKQLRLAYQLRIMFGDCAAALEAEPPMCICASCSRATTFGDAVQEHWRGWAHAQSVMGLPHELPQSIEKLIALPESFAKELHYLEKNNPPQARSEKVAKRIEKLRMYKQFPLTLRADIELNVRRELEKHEAQAYLSAASHLMEQAIEQRCTLEQLQLLGLTREQLFDLLVLRYSIGKEKNQAELRRLLVACMKGDMTWVMNQPANRAYLKQMREREFDVDIWISAFPAYFHAPDLRPGVMKISVEQNPIEVLKMGVYFDTCLSLDGVNAFSSIANATDINKRVIYLRDSKGQVVARQLIAISDEWQLLGYHIYALESDAEKYTRYQRIVEDYARTFAQACRIPLANSGQVRTLVSKSWYDDGTESWTSAEAAKHQEPLPMPMICFGEKKPRR